jgi:hypothetical protein
MINRFVTWLNHRLAGQPIKSNEEIYLKLKDCSSAEIAARLLFRAEIYEQYPEVHLHRIAVLDRLAAEQIERLVAKLNPDTDITPWRKVRDNFLIFFRKQRD